MRTRPKRWAILVGLGVAIVALPATASAELIATESFDDSDGDGELQGEAGGTGWKAADPWAAVTGSTQLVDPGPGVIVHGVPGGGVVNGGTSALRITSTGDDLIARDLAAGLDPVSDPKVYMSFLLRFDQGTINNNDFVVLRLNEGSNANLGIKSDQGPGSTDFIARFANDASKTAWAPDQLALGETYLIAGLLENTNGNADSDYEEFSIWVNPAFADSLSPEATATTSGGDVGTITALAMRSFQVGGSDVLFVDELRVGSKWSDVVPPVPEPATCLLWPLALAAVAYRSRRRKRRPAQA